MKYQRYEAYAKTGVSWLPETPLHWDVLPFRFCAHVSEGQVLPSEERYQHSILIAPNHIEPHFGKLIAKETVAQQGAISGKYVVNRGDVVYSKIRPALSKVYLADEDCLCSADMYPIKVTDRLKSKFLFYLMLSGPFVDLMVSESMRVAMPKVNRETLAGVRLVLPSISEQSQICRFLDLETAKADALLEKYRLMVRTLEERRATVFANAVTKGLNSNVRLKWSGIDWIGNIPEHWNCVSTSSLFEVSLGKMVDEKRRLGTHLVPYLRVADVQWDEINTDDLPTIDIRPDEYHRYLLRPGDLLVNEGGSYPGRCAIWNGALDVCAFQKALHRLRPRHKDAVPEFMSLVLRVVTDSEWLLADQGKSTIAHIPAEDMKRLRVPCPPRAEQLEIVKRVSADAASIRMLESKITEAIALVSQRRMSLITAAVTGQIDVRKYLSNENAEWVAA